MTRAQFAMRLARIASTAATWSADVLTMHDRASDQMNPEAADRFIREVREKLNWLKEDIY